MSKINLDNLNRAHDKRFKAKRIEIECEGETFPVKVDLVFKDSKIRELVSKTAEDMEQAEAKGLADEILVISNMNIIRTFTDVDFTEDLSKNLQMFEVMTDLGITEKILNAFDENEFEKITEYMNQIQENLPKVLEALKENNENLDIQQMLSGDSGGIN